MDCQNEELIHINMGPPTCEEIARRAKKSSKKMCDDSLVREGAEEERSCR